MDFLKQNKGLIVAVIVFAIGIYIYSSYQKTAVPVTSADKAAERVGFDVLELSASLDSVILDQDLFASDLYRHLVDFSTPLQPQTPGRANPFSPIGRD